MTTSAETIRNLLFAHYRGDEAGFRSAASAFIENERRLNHQSVVNDLERILEIGNGSLDVRRDFMRTASFANGNLPRDKERNAVLVEICEPRRELESLVLAPAARETLDRIVQEKRRSELLGSHGLRPIGKVLFCGPPGCGKTVAAEALAKELYLPLATVRFDAVVSSYLGETAANLRKVFEFARLRPVVLLFDEFDAIGKNRMALDEHGELKRVVNSFLQLLDGFVADTLTIAATNHEGLLDPALWRRFDEVLVFPRPVAADIEQLLARQFRQPTLSRAIRLADVAQRLVGLSHAEVERLALDAIKQTILFGNEKIEVDVLEASIARQLERVAATDRADESQMPLRPSKRARRTKSE